MALEKELAQYRKLRAQLEKESIGKWVLIRDDDYVGTFDTLERAAEEATRRFGRGPYLLREVGAPDVTLPASVVYSAIHAAD